MLSTAAFIWFGALALITFFTIGASRGRNEQARQSAGAVAELLTNALVRVAFFAIGVGVLYAGLSSRQMNERPAVAARAG